MDRIYDRRDLRQNIASDRMARLLEGTSMTCFAAAAIPGPAPQAQITPEQQNQLARNLIFSQAKPILQQIGGARTFATVTTGNNTMTINPLQIGFLRRFIVVVTGTVTNTGAGSLTLTPNGADNLITNLTFNDFTGTPRHNCSGRSLSYVEAAKYKRIPGAAYSSDSVSGFGSIIPS